MGTHLIQVKVTDMRAHNIYFDKEKQKKISRKHQYVLPLLISLVLLLGGYFTAHLLVFHSCKALDEMGLSEIKTKITNTLRSEKSLTILTQSTVNHLYTYTRHNSKIDHNGSLREHAYSNI